MLKPINLIRQSLEGLEQDIPKYIKTGVPENVKSDNLRSIEQRNNTSVQDILDHIEALQSVGVLQTGFPNPNTEPPDEYYIGQLYLQKNQSTNENIALYLYTGINELGWWKFQNFQPIEFHYGTISDPNDNIPDGDFRAGDYYIETSDGTPGGDFVSIWLFTNLASGFQFVNPYGSQGPAGPAGPTGPAGQQGPAGPAGPSGENGEDGTDGTTPHVGGNGNWWIGETDTGIRAGLVLKTVYDNDITGIRNGTNNNFVAPDIYKPGTLKVYADGILLTKGNNDDYIELLPGQAGNGATINRVLTDNNKLIFEYEVL